MTRPIWNLFRGVACAAALLAVSVELASASAARVSINTNLRQGPGVGFGIISTVPGGSVVEVIRCGGEWCNVMAGGSPGYMVARNLIMGAGPITVVRPAPRVVLVEPAPVYYGYRPYYYGPGIYYGPRRYWRRW